MTSRSRSTALALSLVVASCAGGIGMADDGTSGSGGERTPDALAFADEPAGETVLRLALVEPDSINPATVSLVDQSAVIVADLLYDGLTEVDGATNTLRPGLARSWAASEDLTRWTFLIDGERTSAEAVATHFQALLDGSGPGLSAPTAFLLSGVVTVEVTTPSADHELTEPVGPGVRLVTEPGQVPLADDPVDRADGGGAVTFTLDRPDGGFAWLLSGLGASVVDIDGGPTGRFRPDVATSEGLHLVRSPGGADADDEVVGPDDDPTTIDRIEIRWSADADAAYETLTLGLVDASVTDASLLDDAVRRFGHEATPRGVTVLYGLQLDGVLPADIDDAERAAIRRAVVAAISPETRALAARTLGGMPIESLIAPGLAGAPGPGPGATAAEEADLGELLAGTPLAGDGIELPVTYTNPDHRTTAEAIARDLTAAGLVARAEQLPAEVQAVAIAERAPGLFAFGWVASAGSVDAVAPLQLSSASSANVFGFASAEIDDALARAARTADDGDRWELYALAQELAVAEGRVVPVVASVGRLVASPAAPDLVVRVDGSLDVEAAD